MNIKETLAPFVEAKVYNPNYSKSVFTTRVMSIRQYQIDQLVALYNHLTGSEEIDMPERNYVYAIMTKQGYLLDDNGTILTFNDEAKANEEVTIAERVGYDMKKLQPTVVQLPVKI